MRVLAVESVQGHRSTIRTCLVVLGVRVHDANDTSRLLPIQKLAALLLTYHGVYLLKY